MRFFRQALAAMLILCAGPLAAQELIGSYRAFIGEDDLYNSQGARLTQAWQVLRQDRANFHRYGISQPGDDWDPFFSSIDNRAAMERMIMQGGMAPAVRQRIMQGNATVEVRIWGRSGRGEWVEVTVPGATSGTTGTTGTIGRTDTAGLIGSYTAFIGGDDLYNSRGARLTEPWQVLRQDRANYHRFGIRQPGDEWDPFFSSAENRAAMERMILNGRIDPAARQWLLRGGATVYVRIYGSGGVGRSVEVTVSP